jgi:ABC-2 type transport system ATP-binding protein
MNSSEDADAIAPPSAKKSASDATGSIPIPANEPVSGTSPTSITEPAAGSPPISAGDPVAETPPILAAEPGAEVKRGPTPEDAAAFESVMAPLRLRPEDDIVPITVPRPQDDYVPTSTDALLKVVGLRKTYGTHVALDNISFELNPGDILGFLGPNGAGKTTCLRILATILKADSGSATIAGHGINEIELVRRQIGYMPDFIGTYDDLHVFEYLEFFARAYAVKADLREFAIAEALTTTGLSELRTKPVDGLSRGQKQRLALARLLMHDPPVLLLDEPAAGLDPRARVELRDILRNLQKKGKAIIVSSHVLEDLTDLANKVAVIDNGRLLAFGATTELLSRLRDSRRWRVRLRDDSETERLRTFLQEQRDVTEVVYAGKELYVTFKGGDEVVERVHQRLFENKFRLLEFAEEALGLEELYLRITGSSA